MKKHIYFGIGNVLVESWFSVMIIRIIEPSQVIGSNAEESIDSITTLEKYEMCPSLESLHELKKSLEKVRDMDDKIIEFKDFIFDFNKYNPKSVDVVLNIANHVISNILRCMAC